MKVTVEIPENEVISFIEMSKLKNYKVSIENAESYKTEFIKKLDEAAAEPLNKSRSARTIIEDLKQKHRV